MQDQSQVENKAVQQPAKKQAAELTPEQAKAERDAAQTRWIKSAKPAAEAECVLIPRLATEKKIRLAGIEIEANKPVKLKREHIRRLANLCALSGKRWTMVELPPNWKAWK